MKNVWNSDFRVSEENFAGAGAQPGSAGRWALLPYDTDRRTATPKVVPGAREGVFHLLIVPPSDVNMRGLCCLRDGNSVLMNSSRGGTAGLAAGHAHLHPQFPLPTADHSVTRVLDQGAGHLPDGTKWQQHPSGSSPATETRSGDSLATPRLASRVGWEEAAAATAHIWPGRR